MPNIEIHRIEISEADRKRLSSLLYCVIIEDARAGREYQTDFDLVTRINAQCGEHSHVLDMADAPLALWDDK